MLTFLVNRVTSSCVKVDKEMFIQVPNYRTAIVHTNACREELSATIEPNIVFVGNMQASSAYVKEYRDMCCCKVMNSSRHTVRFITNGRSLNTQRCITGMIKQTRQIDEWMDGWMDIIR